MKITITLLFVLFLAGTLCAQPLFEDDFSYPNGSLSSQAAWGTHRGTAGQVQVVNSKFLIIQDNSQSEDVNASFPVQNAGSVYCRMEINVSGTTTTGTDYEYFTHFNSGTFRARVDVVGPNVNGGDYTLGISNSGSSADATWPTDLSYGITYKIVIKYDLNNDVSQLWINPLTEASPSIISLDESSPQAVSAIAFRQSSASFDETITIDKVKVTTSFSEALPVVLSKFNVGNDGSKAFINWQTSSEINNDFFDIEHSRDGKNFMSIGSVAGNGNSGRRIDYNFTHETPLKGQNYYRLKQVDFDGGYEYSDIKNSFFGTRSNISVFPTVTNGNLYIDGLSEDEVTSYRVMNIGGQVFSSGQLNENILDLHNLPNGNYMIQLSSQTVQDVVRFVKQ